MKYIKIQSSKIYTNGGDSRIFDLYYNKSNNSYIAKYGNQINEVYTTVDGLHGDEYWEVFTIIYAARLAREGFPYY